MSTSTALTDMEQLKASWNPLHLHPSVKRSPDYEEVISNIRNTDADDIAKDGKSTTNSSREATLGRLVYPSDIISGIASLIPLFQAFTDIDINNYDATRVPFLVHRGLQWINVLATESFRHLYGSQLREACKWAAHSLATPFFQFFANVANEIKNDILHSSSTPSSLFISQTIATADARFVNSLNQLVLDVDRQSVQSFVLTPVSFSAFRGDKEDRFCPFTRQFISSKSSESSESNRTPRTQRIEQIPSSEQPARAVPQNTKGFIVSTIGGLPHFPRIASFTPCRNWLLAGKSCTFPNCSFAHKTFPKDYSVNDCRTICTYVTGTEGLSFTEDAQRCLEWFARQAPPSGTPHALTAAPIPPPLAPRAGSNSTQT